MSEIALDSVTAIAVNNEEMTYSNKVYLSPLGRIPVQKQFIKIKGYVLPVAFSDAVPKGKIGLNKKFREFLTLSLIDETSIQGYDPKESDKPASCLHIKIEMLVPPKEKVEIDDAELIKQFKKDYNRYYVSVEQVFVVSFQKVPLIITIDRVLGGDGGLSYLAGETTI